MDEHTVSLCESQGRPAPFTSPSSNKTARLPDGTHRRHRQTTYSKLQATPTCTKIFPSFRALKYSVYELQVRNATCVRNKLPVGRTARGCGILSHYQDSRYHFCPHRAACCSASSNHTTIRQLTRRRRKNSRFEVWGWVVTTSTRLLWHKNMNCLYDSNIYPPSGIKTGFREEIDQPLTPLSVKWALIDCELSDQLNQSSLVLMETFAEFLLKCFRHGLKILMWTRGIILIYLWVQVITTSINQDWQQTGKKRSLFHFN